ncbi:hypothetical protein VIGAN_02216300 [Vigna angularis var. angularis]|uniref:Uncharacterized protein n=1 Tax=Vigna angularis var. angularis TaxID=157739 RepID=A0A0S3RFG6_PHAAN|nr:hypothetical protein VIGAN_02216300 [Vigna angularis var. angularis]
MVSFTISPRVRGCALYASFRVFIFVKLMERCRNNVLERKYRLFNVGDEKGLPSVTVKISNCGEHNEGENSFDL